MKNPIFVALDVDSDAHALSLAEQVAPYVGGFKVGPRLTYKYGQKLVEELSSIGPVFVDNKYHDIPSTVLAALRSTFEAGAQFATIHASNGPETLSAVALLETELNQKRPFRVLCVTVLTSFEPTKIPTNWQKLAGLLPHVEALAADAIHSGLRGLVCSPEEVQLLRSQHPGAYLVTPGIRLPGHSKDDQSRTMGPREALQAGASAIVVGRPIVAADDPIGAAQRFAALVSRN